MTLRARVFVATLAASLLAVGAALAIGVFATREAIRDTAAREVEREARVVAARASGLARAGVSDAALVDQANLPPRLRRLLDERLPPGASPETGVPPRPGQAGGPPPAATPFAGAPPGARAAQPQILPTAAAAQLLPRASSTLIAGGRGASGNAVVAGTRVLFAAEPVQGRALFVLASRPDAAATDDFGRYFSGLAIAAIAAAVLSGAAAALIARRLTRPIAEVVAAAGAVAAGRTPERLEEPEVSELAELARSFNEMSEQLALAREAERTVLMSASHELRTPLTAISGYAEGIEDATVDTAVGAAVIRAEAERLERLVQDLLVLARLDQGVFEARTERVNLASVAAAARDRLALRARDAGVKLRITASADSVATADADRVLQVVTNLVDNAIRVTPRGGVVRIETGPGTVRVVDTGPGIPATDLPHVFDRFHLRRAHGMGSPDGSGIGLAIVRELTEAMGGAVAVAGSEGNGTTFTVSLPRDSA